VVHHLEPGAQLITHLYIEWEISLMERTYEATHEELQSMMVAHNMNMGLSDLHL